MVVVEQRCIITRPNFLLRGFTWRLSLSLFLSIEVTCKLTMMEGKTLCYSSISDVTNHWFQPFINRAENTKWKKLTISYMLRLRMKNVREIKFVFVSKFFHISLFMFCWLMQCSNGSAITFGSPPKSWEKEPFMFSESISALFRISTNFSLNEIEINSNSWKSIKLHKA